MGDALAVRILERVKDLRHDAHNVGRRKSLIGLEVLLELTAVDELHGDEPDAVFLTKVVDGNDVGMGKAPCRLRFSAKARDDVPRVLPGELICADSLECNAALDQRIIAFIDDAHRTPAKLASDLVLAEPVDLCHGLLLVARLKTATPARAGVADSATIDVYRTG